MKTSLMSASRRLVRAGALLSVCLVSPGLLAAGGGPVTKKADTPKATANVKLAKATTTVIKPVATAADAADAVPLSAHITVATSVGIGSFVSGPTRQVAVATGITPKLSYKLADKMALSGAVGATIYHVNEFASPFYNGRVLMGDAYLTFSHASVAKHEESGFNLSGAFRLYFPTSLSSRFQNRIFSMRPSFTASIKAGPVSFSLTSMFTKYFNTSTSPSLDCATDFGDGGCKEGRPDGPSVGGGFESEIRGGEVFLPSVGVFSFYVGNSLSIGWTIMDGLSLSTAATVYSLFGYRSFEMDEFSSDNAKAGRSQIDRLITSVELSYQIMKKLSVALNFSTDTLRPFGADGNDLVVFDLERASDNISSIGLSFAGTL